LSDTLLHNADMTTRDSDLTSDKLLAILDERDELLTERDHLISQVLALQTIIHEMRFERFSTCLECGHPFRRACSTHQS
jgi:hypothetical protein